jgi:hypothetical protein
VDILVQINIVDEIRRVTAISRVEKQSSGEEVKATPLWRYDPDSSADNPHWSQVAEKKEETETVL